MCLQGTGVVLVRGEEGKIREGKEGRREGEEEREKRAGEPQQFDKSVNKRET